MIVHNSTILSPILFQSNLCGCHLHFWRIYDSYMPTRQAFQDCTTNLDLHPIRVDLGQKRKQDIRICTLNLTKKARATGEILRTHAHMRGGKGHDTSCFSPPSLPISCSPGALLACKNSRFSSLFAAGDVSRGGTSATQRQKFHTDDANQCLHNKSGSHGVPNTNLSNFTCLLVDFGKVLCSSANELQQNSNASSREDYIPQILTVLLEIHRFQISPLWPFVRHS